MLTTMAALGWTSAVVHETASTVDKAAINTLHSNRVARNTDPPTLPPPPPPLPLPLPLPGIVALTAPGELVRVVSKLVPGGSLAGDKGPTLDKLAPPTDDTEL